MTYEKIAKLLQDTLEASIHFPEARIDHVYPNSYVISFSVPGYTSAAIKVRTKGRRIYVTGLASSVAKGESSIYAEFYLPKFSREFDLPDNLFLIKTELVDGILSLTIDYIDPEPVVEYPINVPQPTSTEHPQILNEDSSI